MDNAQLATLKAFIIADPTLGPMFTGPAFDFVGVQNGLNAKSATDAWRKSVSPDEVDDAPNYSTFDTIQAGKRDSWGFFLRQSRDFTRNKVRKWVTDVWGNATIGSEAEAILKAGIEKATVAENAIGGTVKTTNDVSALDRDWIGTVTLDDVNAMARL